ncbi:hypothetical protein HBI24_156110 [Parastagonospora nodorum]|nr:hypothetical protein HBH53_097490 [Parastagonospora nodorum]KAH3993260.1 hypothetical protein HBI10_205770 [Parastagonospora nodorum]KAH4011195.1 hypothetical protein HBI13_201520 [Parastagonospora nodorum]KAH4037499.1 hypothetical protein HBI09_071400 [Parastagonospora nodorum]KAH4151938.1 hypothetical protein HBH43_238190 [Parastagonospora nodorum]
MQPQPRKYLGSRRHAALQCSMLDPTSRMPSVKHGHGHDCVGFSTATSFQSNSCWICCQTRFRHCQQPATKWGRLRWLIDRNQRSWSKSTPRLGTTLNHLTGIHRVIHQSAVTCL